MDTAIGETAIGDDEQAPLPVFGINLMLFITSEIEGSEDNETVL